MPSLNGRRFAEQSITVAAAHLASPILDKARGVAKAQEYIAKAAKAGVRLIVFPESFIPGFPLWNAYTRPIDAHGWFARLCDNALRVDGPELAAIAETASYHRVFVCLGFTELASYSRGCIWNSNALIGDDGTLLNLHRKLVPTFYEKLTWTPGDGAGLRVIQTEIGRLGTLICGENGNPLARYSLMAQGEEIHLSNYPPVWPFRNPLSNDRVYDLSDAIRVRAAAHAFEAKCFNVVAAGYLDDESLATLSDGDEERRSILSKSPPSVSMVLGPTGELISELRRDEEGLVLTEIDLREITELKQHHDIAGYYNRFDVFDLRVNRKRLVPITLDQHDAIVKENTGKFSSDIAATDLAD